MTILVIKIACPTLYENEQGIKFNWEENLLFDFVKIWYSEGDLHPYFYTTSCILVCFASLYIVFL